MDRLIGGIIFNDPAKENDEVVTKVKTKGNVDDLLTKKKLNKAEMKIIIKDACKKNKTKCLVSGLTKTQLKTMMDNALSN